jgi:uncharacterized protein YjiS (DUF1127 family)
MSRSIIAHSASASNRYSPARLLKPVAELFRRWLARRRLKELAELDDALLRDIGISRGDLYWAQRMSLRKDPLQELSRVARRRHR